MEIDYALDTFMAVGNSDSNHYPHRIIHTLMQATDLLVFWRFRGRLAQAKCRISPTRKSDWDGFDCPRCHGKLRAGGSL